MKYSLRVTYTDGTGDLLFVSLIDDDEAARLRRSLERHEIARLEIEKEKKFNYENI